MKIKALQFKVKLLIAALSLLVACDKKEPLLSGVILKNMDTLVKPGDNFDGYVNGTWAKSNKIPADKAGIGVGQIINDKAQEDVKEIIENSSKGNFADGSD